MPGVIARGGPVRRRRTMNEINMVPFIDVMLVLLIIFMVSAPLITTGVVDLPSVGRARQRPPSVSVRGAEAVIITVPDESAMLRAVAAVRRMAPGVFVAARANFLSTAIKAKAAGADHVTVEEMATAAAMEKEITVQLAARISSRQPPEANAAGTPAPPNSADTTS